MEETKSELKQPVPNQSITLPVQNSNPESETNTLSNNRYLFQTQDQNQPDPNVLKFARSMNFPKGHSIFNSSLPKTHPTLESQQFQIPESEYIWKAPYLKKTQIFPSYVIAPKFPTKHMLKDLTKKLRERSCSPEEYTKPVNVEDFVKYDRYDLWKTSNDVMNQYIPKIEQSTDGSSAGVKTSMSPLLAKQQKDSESKEYFDPLKKYAQIAMDEGNHIARNPLNNHKLIQNNYFPISNLVGSYWDKVEKESYFKNRYDNLGFDPTKRDSGYSVNLSNHINFAKMFDKDSVAGQPHPKEDYKQSEYRNNFWRNKGFPYGKGPKPIAHSASALQLIHYK